MKTFSKDDIVVILKIPKDFESNDPSGSLVGTMQRLSSSCSSYCSGVLLGNPKSINWTPECLRSATSDEVLAYCKGITRIDVKKKSEILTEYEIY